MNIQQTRKRGIVRRLDVTRSSYSFNKITGQILSIYSRKNLPGDADAFLTKNMDTPTELSKATKTQMDEEEGSRITTQHMYCGQFIGHNTIFEDNWLKENNESLLASCKTSILYFDEHYKNKSGD